MKQQQQRDALDVEIADLINEAEILVYESDGLTWTLTSPRGIDLRTLALFIHFGHADDLDVYDVVEIPSPVDDPTRISGPVLGHDIVGDARSFGATVLNRSSRAA